ncbi:MAG: hypothetical protein E6Q39_00910 [Crocinitomicaceae bacterium]|nr:MAG: hypothetical protein E6Q39_00910 [Crocinitomicaceae bacterium]
MLILHCPGINFNKHLVHFNFVLSIIHHKMTFIMKQFFLSVFLMLYAFLSLEAQAPHIFNYQGVARNATGIAYSNQSIYVRVNIRNYGLQGTILYSETRNVTTNQFGLFSIGIGSYGASNVQGDITTIDWASAAKYLETEISLDGQAYTSIGSTRMLSVPFAQFSTTSKDLVLPYTKTINESVNAFEIVNNYNYISSSAIRGSSPAGGKGVTGYSESGFGILGSTNTGTGIVAYATAPNALALYAENLSGGTALEIDGGLKIRGGNTNPGAGKVLTSDAGGNATWQDNTKVAFRASGLNGNAAQSILPFASTKINFFETSRYNIGNAYNASASTFVVPVTGIYHLNTQVTWANNELNGQLRLKLLRAGNYSDIAFSSLIKTGASALEHALAVDIRLQQGDQVWVEVLQDVGVIKNILADGSRTWFSGHLIVKD